MVVPYFYSPLVSIEWLQHFKLGMASPSNGTPGMDTSRTRAQVKEILRRLLTSIETQERQVDSAIQQLADIPKSDLPDFLSAQRDLFMAQQQEQFQEWGALLGNTEPEVRTKDLFDNIKAVLSGIRTLCQSFDRKIS